MFQILSTRRYENFPGKYYAYNNSAGQRVKKLDQHTVDYRFKTDFIVQVPMKIIK